MTIHAVELGFNATMEELKRVKRQLQQVNSYIKEIEQQIAAAKAANKSHTKLKEKLKIQRATHDRIAKALLCLECSLRDRSLLDRTLAFTNKQLNFLVRMINPN